MKVLVIGGGGREHALAWRLSKSPQVTKLYAAPGSDAIALLATCVPIKGSDIESLTDFAEKEGIDLTMVGPEDPLALGVVDAFKARGLKIVGPTALAAQLEGSKAFAKDLMQKYAIPTAKFETCTTPEGALAAVGRVGLPVVVKADGLAAGKGVLICHTEQEARDAIAAIMTERAFGAAGERVVVEEMLMGEEASFIALTDGKTVLPMASSQDHKRVFENDEGLNTGGMGAYSPAPVVDDEMHKRIMNEVMIPTIEAMAAEGCPFSGVLYAGVMIASDGVPKVLEFNCRFGDPETQPIMARLTSDFAELLMATAEGRLQDVEAQWDPRPAVCVVMASGGYPASYEKNLPISGIESADAMDDVVVFHAGTRRGERGWESSGGRVLGVTALGDTIETTLARCYEAVGLIDWKDVHYRKDIAKRALGRM